MVNYKYSRVYEASDFKKQDLEFVQNGTKNGCFILIGSDNKDDLFKICPKGKIGLWAFGLTDNGEKISLHTSFERNQGGMPSTCFSLSTESFKFVRFVINPYGSVEFLGLPSEIQELRDFKLSDEYNKQIQAV